MCRSDKLKLQVKKIICALFGFLIFLFLLFLNTKPSYAVTGEITGHPVSISGCQISDENPVCENSDWATVKFTQLTETNYLACFMTNTSDCGTGESTIGYIDVSAVSGQLSIDVCPVNNQELKPEQCGPNDYFESGPTYKVSLYDFEANRVAEVTFQPVLFFPTTTLTPDSGIGTSTSLTVRISGSRRPADNDNRNDYQISFKGESGTADPPNNEECKTVDPSSHTTSWTHGPIDAGEYRIDVTDCDNHDVVFERIWFTVRSDGTGEITRQENDPEGIGSRRSLVGRNPCEGGTCPTAIGNIPTDVTGFSSAFLSIAIGVAGGIALILMVIGSIRILTSSGDPKGVGAGRDMIIAAVAGLLFLIFSVLILHLIGVSILSGIIPGTT